MTPPPTPPYPATSLTPGSDFAYARFEPDLDPPLADMAGRVLAQIRRTPPPASSSRSLPFAAGAGCLLALLSVYGAIGAWNTLSNPLMELGSPSITLNNFIPSVLR